MKEAIIFVNNCQQSIVSSLPEVVAEINHYRAYWLSSVGATYSNDAQLGRKSNSTAKVRIVVKGMTEADRLYIAKRMR